MSPREHRTQDPKFERPGRMLDIGCGAGWFLFQMKEQGWDVKGVEPNVDAADLEEPKRFGYLSRIAHGRKLPRRAFDYVRMNHSFEHMEHPNQILDEVYRILAGKGKLMIGVPNRDSFSARVFGLFWYHLALPVHTFSYSVQTLTQMLSKHNFKVERVVFNTEQTPLLGGLQIYLQSPPCFPQLPGPPKPEAGWRCFSPTGPHACRTFFMSRM